MLHSSPDSTPLIANETKNNEGSRYITSVLRTKHYS